MWGCWSFADTAVILHLLLLGRCCGGSGLPAAALTPRRRRPEPRQRRRWYVAALPRPSGWWWVGGCRRRCQQDRDRPNARRRRGSLQEPRPTGVPPQQRARDWGGHGDKAVTIRCNRHCFLATKHNTTTSNCRKSKKFHGPFIRSSPHTSHRSPFSHLTVNLNRPQ